MNPKFSISIVAHNNLALTRGCIESIFRSHGPEHYELMLTDNGSTDGTLEYFKSLENPRCFSFANRENEGFIGPHNRAFAVSAAEFFVVLNNDVTVCPGWLDAMAQEFEKNPKLALCGIKGTCGAINEHGIGVPTDGPPEYIEGSCLMVRSEVVRPHGLFSEDFRFAYCEDADLSLRMRSLGYDIATVEIPVKHLGAATARLVQDKIDLEGYKIRNHHVLVRKWGSYFKNRHLNHRIVVRRAGARGDVLLVTPVLRSLRARYPKAHIAVSTGCPEVLRGNPNVNEIFSHPGPFPGFDTFLDLDMAYEREPGKSIVRAYADVCRIDVEDPTPEMFPDQTAREVARQLLPDGPRYAVVHTGTIPGWVGRQWGIQGFRTVVASLKGMGYRVVLVGEHATPDPGADIDFRNRPLFQLYSAMERSGLFVGLDSMPFHVAQAARIPAVGIFGSVDPELRVTGKHAVGVAAKSVGCLGCHHYLAAPRTVTASCLRGREICMDRLAPEDVIEAVKLVTQNRKGAP